VSVAVNVVVTGIGLVTPLGNSVGEVLDRIGRGEDAACAPAFDTTALPCHHCARVLDFDAEAYFPDNKALRLMDRSAQMAAVAAHLAMKDAGVRPDETYPAEQIALYGATGISSMAASEIGRIVGDAAGSDGRLDLRRFGRVALKKARPVLSFRILANMPICFVSILENIRGPNAVYTPWEGQGAQAIAAGVRAIQRQDVPCALVGGCDVKTREISFLNLTHLGLFASWQRHGQGCVPGEGAAFLVLESEEQAARGGKRAYARIAECVLRSTPGDVAIKDVLSSAISGLDLSGGPVVVAAGDGDPGMAEAEEQALTQARIIPPRWLRPKQHLGNLFAAAAPVQVGLAAALCAGNTNSRKVLADCFGYGTEQALFVLEETCVGS
jgi:3-oxoacyl-[acyl-carrier-protein] synthase II